MYQSWRRLLFLHWACSPADVQARLPAGLTVETWDGRAWVGLVAFRMEGVRPRFCPALPGVSDFPELNVRTYVHDAKGRSGVWFFSLDCPQRLAVWTARVFFGLPYFRARINERVGGVISYSCRRMGARGAARLEYRGVGESAPAHAGTIEEFLVERYRLFSMKGARLLTGEVWHEPYPLQRVEVGKWSDLPLRQAGIDVAGAAPEHFAFSPGVDTRIFGLTSA